MMEGKRDLPEEMSGSIATSNNSTTSYNDVSRSRDTPTTSDKNTNWSRVTESPPHCEDKSSIVTRDEREDMKTKKIQETEKSFDEPYFAKRHPLVSNCNDRDRLEIARNHTAVSPIDGRKSREAISYRMEQTFLNVNELAEVLRCHPETIRKYAREGRIPSGRIGRTYRFPIEVVELIKEKWLGQSGEEE